MKKINFIAVIILAFLFLVSGVAFAKDIKVDHVAGGFEKIKEKIFLFIIFEKQAKTNYQHDLTEKRLQELEYILESNKIDLLEPTASRYTTYAGSLVNYVLANKVTGKKSDLIKMFEDHEKRAEELQKKVPLDSGWWIALQHSVNVAKMSKEQLKTL